MGLFDKAQQKKEKPTELVKETLNESKNLKKSSNELLKKTQPQKDQNEKFDDSIISNDKEYKESSEGLLAKAQQTKEESEETLEETSSGSEKLKESSSRTIEVIHPQKEGVGNLKEKRNTDTIDTKVASDGLLVQAQKQKKTGKGKLLFKKDIEETVKTKEPNDFTQQKIRNKKVNSERIINKTSKTENHESIEEKKGYGWKKLGSKKIIFDKVANEYRFELIEPELSEGEYRMKKELSHLFKMLADIDTFDMTYEEKEEFLDETLDQIIKDNDVKFDELSDENLFFNLFKNYLDENRKDIFIKNENIMLEYTIEKMLLESNAELFATSRDKIFYHLFRDFLGYGRIDILMHDDGIEDISCDGPETPIFIHHRKYEAIETNIFFDGEEELNSFIVRLCQISGKQISIYSPIVDGKLPDGSRLQATLARTVTKGSTFTIRKFKENPLTPLDLIEFQSLSPEMAAYFWIAIESGASILFCGGTASGKTTALNALSLFIPASHKIVSIEDTREVSLPHKNWIAGTTRKGFSSSEENKTGKDIDMFDLIRAALRQRPRVIIVGEVRGKEAYSLFQAMATGHTSYATVHASTIHTLIQRLENPPISLPRALLTSLDVIVFQNAVEIGKKMVRRMTSVTEIIKLDSDTNQLIFMAPFTWVSRTDDRFESSRNSKIYNRLKQQNDWSEAELDQEIENRISVLEWMRKKNIRSYQEFGRIIAEYQKYPDQVLERVKMEL